MSNAIQDLLRDKPPVMVLDMGLGSREQSLPVRDSVQVRVIANDRASIADPPSAIPLSASREARREAGLFYWA